MLLWKWNKAGESSQQKSQSVKACGLTLDILISESGHEALIADNKPHLVSQYSYPFLRGQA